ncbi:MAG: acyl-CoA dehydrogenase family protein [Pseudomonadales bacterium]|nr:acyl-CoA dehydrogenase family protein [Pseudomonadales bacterium]MBO6563984.1 acyl-CoA dehydrogenase family protein [Pseudomonadales bacterium]MBO6594721.1 acyl-CoA dehydrogenase family protein [Pseudomonadales bacterium]MBO6821719.1 acyl-CoA dehydrogenase family protein [Pseudomonadales bacterium]
MKMTQEPSLEAFRQEVRAWLEEALTPELKEAGLKKTSVWQEINSAIEWQKTLHRQGWGAPDWPEEYGGTGWSLEQRYVFAEECARANTPGLVPMGVKMCAPMLIGYGTDEQKARYLPRILDGTDMWCQGYSEPGSGSDLASLKTMAVSDGDDYIINGTKIWTSYAQHSNMMFALVRTSTEGIPQKGISFILIDMATPGIKIEPIINLEGTHELNQVFFDDVRVPKTNRVGAENEGWTVAKYLLQFERTSMSSIELRRQLQRIERVASQTGMDGQTLADDADFQKQLSELKIDAMAMEVSEKRVLADLSDGKAPGPVSSLLNFVGSETLQRAEVFAVQTLGNYGIPYELARLEIGYNGPPLGPDDAMPILGAYLNARARTIAGGSSQVQRNIVAKAMLGM